MKKIRTWSQLMSDPRVFEVWTEDNDGTDYWVALRHPWVTIDGTSSIHEWSKKACIDELNSTIKSEAA